MKNIKFLSFDEWKIKLKWTTNTILVVGHGTNNFEIIELIITIRTDIYEKLYLGIYWYEIIDNTIWIYDRDYDIILYTKPKFL